MATTTETETEQERKVREEQEQHEREELAKRRSRSKGTPEGTQTGGDSAEAQEPSGEEPAPGGDTTEPPEGHLLDPSEYETEELALPKVDGEGVDKIQAKFRGGPWLERSDPRDVALIRDTKLGQTVTLMVECEVGPPVPGYTTNREGDLDALSLGRTFTVISVYRATVPDS